MMRKLIAFFILLALTDACVDRLYFDLKGEGQGTLVIDGMITDQPGPYSIKISRSLPADDVLNNAQPVVVKSIALSNDLGNSETLTYAGDGVYKTDPSKTRGEIGRKYSIKIELLDGSRLESQPEELLPVGNIDSVYYAWESLTPIGEIPKYGFKVFLDAQNSVKNELIRWRFSGFYMVQSYPQFRRFNAANCTDPPAPPDPPLCSGHEFTGRPFFTPGIVISTGPCSCCFCWVSDYENGPKLNSDILNVNGHYKGVEVGYVPFNQWSFGMGKYMVRVEQMSLTRGAYEYWKIFKDQKDGTTSLFQPSFGKAKTNFESLNSNINVSGYFYASALKKKVVYITATDAKIGVPPYDVNPPEDNCALWRSCEEVFVNASRTPPSEWE